MPTYLFPHLLSLISNTIKHFCQQHCNIFEREKKLQRISFHHLSIINGQSLAQNNVHDKNHPNTLSKSKSSQFYGYQRFTHSQIRISCRGKSACWHSEVNRFVDWGQTSIPKYEERAKSENNFPWERRENNEWKELFSTRMGGRSYTHKQSISTVFSGAQILLYPSFSIGSTCIVLQLCMGVVVIVVVAFVNPF